MNNNRLKWTTSKDEGMIVFHNGENDKFFAGIEYIGVDLHGNQMWDASLFSKESGKPIPVSTYGIPFTSVSAAKEAIIKAINK